MRTLVTSCLILSCIVLQSCKKNETPKEVEAIQAEAEKPVSVDCYQAIYENDTVDLKLNTLKSGKIGGDMVMKVAGAAEKVGKIQGEFRGDTLFVDYTFIEEGNKNKTFKNPMAFLKRDQQLILGNGTMQTTMGVTYLVKDQPIDFDRVKYKFTSIPCK
ncbi:hypothetical protein SGQ44_04950 [Flavobacterium sp. Fl-77]|uniref:Lipoprotein n=1 Tax=Flavobacterium flavipigmentatum TaxID=2893884 RepID=A0AAJ2SDT1_9FLAO|nr:MULTISPECIES: hypothetical protein [unclassified Flavobacterium]MDX6181876.1 hypothetical protein [Flavobacterium sp. Fl-33]MDX6185090.1 hypothetical protein [Flavobacterium sp. Fl-77]UFH37199.1 hypothetical protein LNP22_10680 [Flavobacterium sp. F-70]